MFGGPGWTWVRAQGALREAADKVAEGGQFFTRGIRLLGSDVNSAAVLFYRAAAGASLKPREARARFAPSSCDAMPNSRTCPCWPWISTAGRVSAASHVAGRLKG